MEEKYTKDSNKKKYRLIKKTIPFCKFKTNQKIFTNQLQLDDGLVSSAQRFYKNSKSLPVKIVENKIKPQQGVSSLSFKKSQEQAKAKMRLEELKKKFINLLMRDGEKSKAYKLFAHSLKQIKGYEEKRVLKNNTLRDTGEGIQGIHIKVFDFFTAQKKHLLDLNQKQHKQKKEKKNNTTNNSDRVEQNYYNDFLKKNILYQAVENVKPTLELRRVRKGGTTYQVPAIVSQKRQERLAIKWIIESAEKKNKKSNNSFSNCLLSEILDAFNKVGQPRQRRDEQLKVAEFNRAYTRYRWW